MAKRLKIAALGYIGNRQRLLPKTKFSKVVPETHSTFDLRSRSFFYVNSDTTRFVEQAGPLQAGWADDRKNQQQSVQNSGGIQMKTELFGGRKRRFPSPWRQVAARWPTVSIRPT